jgi:predicted ester cyclase
MRPDICPADSADVAVRARGALERVCSGKGLEPSDRYYAPTFVDHVNDLEFRGLEGTRQSVDLYKAVLDDIEVKVEEQVVDGNRVTSRFVVTGRSGSRGVRFNGITISRFENGKIVEDWSVTDTLSLLRQIGALQAIRLGLKTWRTMKAAR